MEEYKFDQDKKTFTIFSEKLENSSFLMETIYDALQSFSKNILEKYVDFGFELRELFYGDVDDDEAKELANSFINELNKDKITHIALFINGKWSDKDNGYVLKYELIPVSKIIENKYYLDIEMIYGRISTNILIATIHNISGRVMFQ